MDVRCWTVDIGLLNVVKYYDFVPFEVATLSSVNDWGRGLFWLFIEEKPDCRRKLMKKRPMGPAAQIGAISSCKRKRILMEKPESCEEGAKKESDDCVELDERTAQILDEELQAVMIKVWQSLPDEPPSAAEKYVAERLRNEASDDIRNVLGLNVTKRLLNIYNPLIVIVHFTKDPSPDHLKQFMKTYNIQKMKRHAHSLNLHVASMSSIEHFDKLCTAKNVRCGDAKVKVKPTYRFMISPAKLKSAFTKQNKTASKSKEDESSGNLVINNKNEQDFTNANPVKEQVKGNLSKSIESKHTVQNETSISNVAKKQESVQNVTPNKKPDSEKSASQDIVSTNKPGMTETATVQNVIKTVSKTTTPTNTSTPVQVKQGVAATKVTTAPKAAENSTASKPNQNNQKLVETKKVEATLKSEKCDKTPNTTKPSPNQDNKQVAVTKNITQTTPKLTMKSIETINATKPIPNEKTTQVSETVTESAPKPAVKNNETKPNPGQNKPQVAVTKNVTATTPKPTVNNSETINATKSNPNQKTAQVAATQKVTATTQKPTMKTDVTTNATKANPNPNKPQVAATKKVTATTPKMTVKSDSNVSKPKVNQTKVATKKTTEALLKSTKKGFMTIDSEEIDEDDVMDDEEILALISSGVVLDECSGSDDD